MKLDPLSVSMMIKTYYNWDRGPWDSVWITWISLPKLTWTTSTMADKGDSNFCSFSWNEPRLGLEGLGLIFATQYISSGLGKARA